MEEDKSVTASFTLDQQTLTVGKTGSGLGTITGPGIDCGSDCTELINYGTQVVLIATANPGSTFTSWTGCNTTSENTCTVNITGNKSVSASFTLNQHTLTATTTGTGSGTLSASGLSCVGDTCTGTYNYGDTVTITATSGSGSVFGAWTGCDSFADKTCTVTITSEKSVTASFFLEYTLAIILEGTGDGRVMSTPSGIDCEPTCSNTFIVGTPIQLTARPYAGSVFAYWSGGCTGTTDTCEIEIAGNTEVRTHFTSVDTKRCKLKIKKVKKNRGSGNVASNDGNIICGESCFYTYYKDTVVTLSSVADEGSTFIGWKPTTLNCSGTDPCTVTVDKAKSVQAVFVGDYMLKVVNKSKRGGTGTVTSIPVDIYCATVSTAGCEYLYGYGEQITLSAFADTGSVFVGWSPAKLCPGIDVCVVPMDKKRTIKAVFSGP
jgi:hypothetical protein